MSSATIAPDSGIDFTNSGDFQLQNGTAIGGATNWVGFTNTSTAQ